MFKRKAKPVKVQIESHRLIERARSFATWMDAAWTVPIIRKKVGLDPLIGLIPGAGDAVSLAMSTYLLWVAYQLNMPPRVFLGLLINVAADFAIGTVPVVGDIADFFWKSNLKNLQLLENAYQVHGDRSHLRVSNIEAAPQNVIIDITPNT